MDESSKTCYREDRCQSKRRALIEYDTFKLGTLFRLFKYFTAFIFIFFIGILPSTKAETASMKIALRYSKDAIKSSLSEVNTQKDERYAVYDKMKRAVRQKMIVDGFLPREIDAYLCSPDDILPSSSSTDQKAHKSHESVVGSPHRKAKF